MNMNAIVLLTLAMAAPVAVAQERASVSGYSTQVNWSVLGNKLDLINAQNQTTAAKVDAMAAQVEALNDQLAAAGECGKNGMVWSGTDCEMPKSDARLSCRVVKGVGASPTYLSTATCNADEMLTGGGGLANQAGSPICSSNKSGFIHNSSPLGNSWVVDAYQYNIGGDLCTISYAICCKVLN